MSLTALKYSFTTLLLAFLVMAASSKGIAQSLAHSHSVPIKAPIAISTDRQGNIYVADTKGSLNKYEQNGRPIVHFSPQKLAVPSLVEAWFGLQTFIFYRDFQEYTLLDRFLNPTPNYRFPEEMVGFARMATLAPDNNLWIFDDSDFSLKKFNPRQNNLISKNPLDLLLNLRNYDITYMREYQNNLYVSDKNSGILVFDNLGNYRKKLPFSGLDTFGFADDELFYLKDGQLHFFNLYSFAERAIELPPLRGIRFAFVNAGQVVVLDASQMHFFSVQP
jgi:hypothetical protein